MEKFILKPCIDFYTGVRVTKDTVLEFENEKVKQTVKDLEYHSITTVKGENFESKHETTVHLNEGDILIFEEEGRGYIKPVERLCSVSEAIEELNNIKDLG